MQGLYIWAKEILVYFYLYGNHSVVNTFNFFFPLFFYHHPLLFFPVSSTIQDKLQRFWCMLANYFVKTKILCFMPKVLEAFWNIQNHFMEIFVP